MTLRLLALAVVVLAPLAGQAPAPAPTTPAPAAAAAREPSGAELKAAIVRLQAQVLERDRELGQLKARIAELELAALSRAIDTLDPEVRTLLGVTKPAAPATPEPPAVGTKPPR